METILRNGSIIVELGFEDLPGRVRDGADQLFANGVYFAPVRHHSPSCALAVRTLIEEVRPSVVLIEGPDDFTELVPLLVDSTTKPPVAVLAQNSKRRENSSEPNSSAFFPMCDYSPEWVALRSAHQMGAQVAFIDRPWVLGEVITDKSSEGRALESLQAERYMAHSNWLKALSINSGCRDNHELWDHLFECRGVDQITDWRLFLRDVFLWCAMARIDYEPEVLELDNSLPRERHMSGWIKTWRDKTEGSIVVVTGGFHTLELLNWASSNGARKTPDTRHEHWLIRYGFEQLDALNHYASGMPSPAYYQTLWEELNKGAPNPWMATTQSILQQLVGNTRKLDLADSLSTADLQSAILQASRLAELRGHAGPCRTDLLDAFSSCFLKRADDGGSSGLISDAHRLLTGRRLGDIPACAGSPPLVEDARRQALQHRVRLDESETCSTRLDIYRNPTHLARSRFFHLMSYLQTGMAKRLNGPDFIVGARLDMLFEEWQYGWSAMVEAKLIELSAYGVKLHDIAMVRIKDEELALAEQGRARSALNAIQLLTRACLIGLHERLPILFELLSEHVNEDSSFNSIVRCGHHLLTLFQAREPLGLQSHDQVRILLDKVWTAALYLLPDISAVKADQEAESVENLVAFREMAKRLAIIGVPIDMNLLTERLHQIMQTRGCAPGIEAAAASVLYLDGQIDGKHLSSLLGKHFGIGAEGDIPLRFLNGLIRVAPELLMHEPELLIQLDMTISGWDADNFIAFLPDLRQAFTHLNPKETDRLAKAVSALHNLKEDNLLQHHTEISEIDMMNALRIQQQLIHSLNSEGLSHWIPTDRD